MSDSPKEAVRAFALGLPGAWEDFPWGESAIKVGAKVFAFLGVPGPGDGRMGVKLPESGGALLATAFARPMGYGLGKSGWMEVAFGEDGGEAPPLDLLLECVAESYRAVAPKSLVNETDAGRSTPLIASP